MEVDSSDKGMSRGSNAEVVELDKDKIVVPMKEMAFTSVDEMIIFYKNFGKQMGFSVMTRTSKKGDDGKVKWVTLACSLSGKSKCTSRNPTKATLDMKTDCEARITACVDSSGGCRLNNVILEHNHGLNLSRALSGTKGGASNNGILRDSDELVELTENKIDDNGNKIVEPMKGMLFTNVDEMFRFYKIYGKNMGFPVTKRTSKKGPDGILKWVTLACSRAGKYKSTSRNPLKPKPNTKTECKARVAACVDADGRCHLNTVVLEHNHGLCPSKAQHFRCYQEKVDHTKRKLKMNELAGKQVKKCSKFVATKANDYENATSLEKVRRLQLGEGDAAAIQEYFLKMQAQNTGFFYNMDLDDEGQLRNVFWADGRSRKAYKEFGDVVTFDNTYSKNKDDMTFIVFVGVNHHGQSTLFGCALISYQDTETFLWLFRTWLVCMDACAPNGIVSDQDEAIQKAIENVFPHARHRWCLLHIMNKLPIKLSGYKQYESIIYALQSAVYDSQYPTDFERSWSAVINWHGLHSDEWLVELYNERHRWVPCFVRTNFWAGMSIDQRDESTETFFDGYISSKTNLKQYIEQYDNALRKKVEKEVESNFRSFFQPVPCVSHLQMEKQIQAAYTNSKFKEFQNELTGKIYCEITSVRGDSTVLEHDIREDVVVGEGKKRVIFTVSFDRESCEVKCTCHLFEFRGILCRHAISVLIRNDVDLIPEKYIFMRWRKDVKRCHLRVKISDQGATTEQLRYDKMCNSFTEIADLAADNEESFISVMEWIYGARNVLPLNRQRIGYSEHTPTATFRPSLTSTDSRISNDLCMNLFTNEC